MKCSYDIESTSPYSLRQLLPCWDMLEPICFAATPTVYTPVAAPSPDVFEAPFFSLQRINHGFSQPILPLIIFEWNIRSRKLFRSLFVPHLRFISKSIPCYGLIIVFKIKNPSHINSSE